MIRIIAESKSYSCNSVIPEKRSVSYLQSIRKFMEGRMKKYIHYDENGNERKYETWVGMMAAKKRLLEKWKEENKLKIRIEQA